MSNTTILPTNASAVSHGNMVKDAGSVYLILTQLLGLVGLLCFWVTFHSLCEHVRRNVYRLRNLVTLHILVLMILSLAITLESTNIGGLRWNDNSVSGTVREVGNFFLLLQALVAARFQNKAIQKRTYSSTKMYGFFASVDRMPSKMQR